MIIARIQYQVHYMAALYNPFRKNHHFHGMKNYAMAYILLICLLMGSKMGGAQPHNGEIYASLLASFLNDSIPGFKEIKGERVESYFPEVEVDTLTRLKIRMGETQISYQQLDKKVIERKIGIPISLQDSMLRTKQLVYRDTLSLSEFKHIYKGSPMELRGDSPKVGAVWIRPISIIGGTLAAILGLFLIRSS